MIRIRCSQCGHTKGAPDHYAGQVVRCPKCRHMEAVPSREEASPEATCVIPMPEAAVEQVRPSNSDEIGRPQDEADHQTKQCPFCAERIKKDAVKCRYCGEELVTRLRGDGGVKKAGGVLFQAIGALLLLGGLLAALNFYNMDTTVEVPTTELFGQPLKGGRVHNIGLMQERQIGLLISVGATVAGFISLLVGGALARLR